jgi:glycosyltransferase involved in cell wall biosynthesis
MLLSVLIPVYNYESFLRATLESLWLQTFLGFEIVLVDDGSTDGSLKIAQECALSSPVPMTVLCSGHVGVSAAMKIAFEASSGEFIAVVHADDIHLPQKLEVQLAELQADARVSLVHTEYRCVDEAGADLGFGSHELDLPAAHGDCLRDVLLLRADVRSVSMMFRRSLLSVGRVAHIDEPLVLRRIHSYNRHINVSKFPQFDLDQIAPAVLRTVTPNTLSLEAVFAVHIGSLIKSSVGSGNFGKGLSAVRYSVINLPKRWHVPIFAFLQGFRSFVWQRIFLQLLSESTISRIRSRRQTSRRN